MHRSRPYHFSKIGHWSLINAFRTKNPSLKPYNIYNNPTEMKRDISNSEQPFLGSNYTKSYKVGCFDYDINDAYKLIKAAHLITNHISPSTDSIEPFSDLNCGGSTYHQHHQPYLTGWFWPNLASKMFIQKFPIHSMKLLTGLACLSHAKSQLKANWSLPTVIKLCQYNIMALNKGPWWLDPLIF